MALSRCNGAFLLCAVQNKGLQNRQITETHGLCGFTSKVVHCFTKCRREPPAAP